MSSRAIALKGYVVKGYSIKKVMSSRAIAKLAVTIHYLYVYVYILAIYALQTDFCPQESGSALVTASVQQESGRIV